MMQFSIHSGVLQFIISDRGIGRLRQWITKQFQRIIPQLATGLQVGIVQKLQIHQMQIQTGVIFQFLLLTKRRRQQNGKFHFCRREEFQHVGNIIRVMPQEHPIRLFQPVPGQNLFRSADLIRCFMQTFRLIFEHPFLKMAIPIRIRTPVYNLAAASFQEEIRNQMPGVDFVGQHVPAIVDDRDSDVPDCFVLYAVLTQIQ